jgi:hypothetical protein
MPKSSLSDKTARPPKEPFDPALEDPIALTREIDDLAQRVANLEHALMHLGISVARLKLWIGSPG